MNLDDWKPVRRNTSNYLHQLEAFLHEFIPWRIQDEHAEIASAAELIARRMVSAVAVGNARSWREAARQSLHGRKIYAALQTEASSATVGLRLRALIERNASLIRSLPDDLAQMAARFVATEQRRGRRAAAIAQALEAKLPQLAQSRIQMIARTEVAKAETAITQARSERLGIDWYEWATSEDQRVRPSHRKLAKVLVAWGDAPAPEQLAGERSTLGHYHAGNAPNCRCLALPLISLDEVSWPHEVYAHGRIARVNRQQFEQWRRLPEAA